jgi:hypothetical protein
MNYRYPWRVATFIASWACLLAIAPAGQAVPLLQKAADPPGGAETFAFPGASLRIARPAGFTSSKQFDGWEQEASGASVMLTRIPGPYAEVTKGFDAETLKSRGMTLRAREKVTVDGLPGLLLDVTQTGYGTTYAKWILAFGDATQTFMVMASFPVDRTKALAASLKATVLSAKRAGGTAPAPGAGVPYTLTAGGGLKRTAGPGRALIYTKDGSLPAKAAEDPLFVLAPSIGKALIGDRAQFAEQRLKQTAQIIDLVVTSSAPVRIDGLDGYESVATAKDKTSGTPLAVYQVILFEGEGYVLMQGLVGSARSETYLPAFRAMARSLKRKAP